MDHDPRIDSSGIPGIINRNELFSSNSETNNLRSDSKSCKDLLKEFDSVKFPEFQKLLSDMENLFDKHQINSSRHSQTVISNTSSDASFNLLAEMFPYPVARVELSTGLIFQTNKKFLEMFLLQESLTIDKKFYELFVFDESREVLLDELVLRGSVSDFEAECLKGNSNSFLASLTASRFINNGADEFLVYIRDVEELKSKEKEREILLEKLAFSRAQMEEEAGLYVKVNLQLAESEERLQKTNAAKDKYFSIIGHDLKNPLFIIRSMSEILETEFDDITDEERVSFIKAIRESSSSAFALLEDLLHWARCQSGIIEFNTEPLSLERIAADVFSLVEAQALKKKITLLNNISVEHIVDADKFMVSTILRNLISNAIKFTGNGGRVMITSKVIDELLEISVIDNGIGLSQIDICKLFRIDIKNSEIGKAKEKGTGLGLILCKEFAEKHGGQVWVESELGEGCKFKFTLPRSI